MIGINAETAPLVSAKTGLGIEELLDELVSIFRHQKEAQLSHYRH